MDHAAEETRIAEIVFPGDANHIKTLFGGEALKQMDMVASIAATRYCRKVVVTVSVSKIEFKVPVKVGQLIEFVGKVVKTGSTSLTVLVEMFSEDLLTGDRRLCTTGEFVMVAVDENQKPSKITKA